MQPKYLSTSSRIYAIERTLSYHYSRDYYNLHSDFIYSFSVTFNEFQHNTEHNGEIS